MFIKLASNRAASEVAARARNLLSRTRRAISSGRSRSSYTSDHTGCGAAVLWCIDSGLVSFFIRRCTLVFFR